MGCHKISLAHHNAKAKTIVVGQLLHLSAELQLRAGVDGGIQMGPHDAAAVEAQLELGLLQRELGDQTHLRRHKQRRGGKEKKEMSERRIVRVSRYFER